MACALTIGRKVPCKSAFGGIKSVYLADFGTIASITIDASTKEATIVDASTAPVWFEFDVKGNSSLETTVTSSRENGTTFYTQTISLTLTYLDALTQAELQLIAAARPYAVVVENGMEVTGGTVVTGAAAGDLSGFTLTFEGMEETAPHFLAAAVTGSALQINPTA